MVHANELRLGNLVQFAEDGTNFSVVSIGCDGLDVKNQHELIWIEIDQFEGIPITEEWLLRLGFAEDENWRGFFFKDAVSLELCNGIIKYDMPNSEVIIRHVHTLQNLYFALTGEELEIKEIPQ